MESSFENVPSKRRGEMHGLCTETLQAHKIRNEAIELAHQRNFKEASSTNGFSPKLSSSR
jgi:hypothetical protein